MNGKHTIQIEINGEACHGFAYQTQSGILIHLPGIQAPHALAFETLFQALPEERLSGGFIEAGEWDGGAYAFEGEAAFCLGPDGAVWTKVCNRPEELPLAENAPANHALAWRMLDEAEEAFGAKSLACQAGRTPCAIPDYLLRLEEEAAWQEQRRRGCTPYARALRGLAQELRQLGFSPAISQGERR
jgi:hypothetical protein